MNKASGSSSSSGENLSPTITVDDLYQDTSLAAQLQLLGGGEGLGRKISIPRIQKPGLALTGYADQLHEGRVLSLGKTEIDYLAEVSKSERKLAVDTILAASPVCIVITRGLSAPVELVQGCEDDDVPLLVTSLASGEFFARVTRYLQEKMSPTLTMAGVFLDVLGIGTLLIGAEGIGKSETALELIAKGHRLVADDVVFLRLSAKGVIEGFAPPVIRHHMQIDGVGIVNVKDLFGISSVRDVKRVEQVLELVPAAVGGKGAGEPDTFEVLGEKLPRTKIPMRPGTNTAMLVEIVARDRLLKSMGHDSARLLMQRLDRRVTEERRRVTEDGGT